MLEQLPPKITNTEIWRRTLAPQKGDKDPTIRDRLRNTFMKFRERAEMLSKEISRDFPEFTVHDISHIDALWELANQIIDPKYPLTPAEAFVLGGAFLIHDLGMGLAAYPEGKKALYINPIWKDIIIYFLKEKLGYFPSDQEINSLSKEVEDKAIEEILRNLHAERAEKLVDVEWKDKETNSTSYHLIEDPEIRNTYGPIIGKIAYSHWWSVEKLNHEFTTPLGAAPFVPPDWTVDPLKIACILRVADGIHLDGSRAPGYLKTIRKPSGDSKKHWKFQEKLNKPRIESESLIFTSISPFLIEDSKAWFLCYDTLKKVDNELREIDILFANKPEYRLKVKRVRGVENFEKLRELIPTENWIPMDVYIKVSDIASLVKNFGGKQIYGDDYKVPLRELIQNSIDAIKARGILEAREDDWGDITVRFGEDLEGKWIEVQDNGIGMSLNTLKDSFLDFGKSFWNSREVLNEFPGLLEKGFDPIGKYGIGFFSVFMWGEHVKITTRRYTAGYDQSFVLEFNEGTNFHPIFRNANSEEKLRDPGTRTRIWIKNSPEIYIPSLELPERLCYLTAPCIDVNLFVEKEQGKQKKIISASDWIRVDNYDFVERLGLEANKIKNLKDLPKNLRCLKNKNGKIIGRACVMKPVNVWSTSPNNNTSFITMGGLRSSVMVDDNVLGVFIGSPKNAARNEASFQYDKQAFSTWASEQAELIREIYDDDNDLIECSEVIAFFGGDTKDLPVALSSEGWVSCREICNLFKSKSNVLILDYENYETNYWKNWEFELNKNVLVVKMDHFRFTMRSILFNKMDNFNSFASRSDYMRLSLRGLVIKSLAEAWSVSYENLLSSSIDSYVDQEVGTKDKNPVVSKVVLIENPNLKS